MFGRPKREAVFLLLTSRSFAAAWVGVNVPDFSQKVFPGFRVRLSNPGGVISGITDIVHLWHYGYCPSMAWKK